ncbi:MAG TPA: patatin-like phospholipase family protein [Nitrososphaeraceae archaeon]|nr:patatin-like phospholipase family protein [Nitrososphaeraceae archaeon]
MSDDDAIENVLVLQGGGSLGAFGWGIFKALANNNIKIDIVAGTSIGGVNASGAKQDHPEKVLEKFVDFNKLKPTGQSNSRLIITAFNVLTAEPLIFDSSKQQITPQHRLTATGYPTYYFRWVEVEK